MKLQTLIDGPQPSNAVPRTKLSNKMKLAAILRANGYSIAETADYLDLNKAHLAIVDRSELFQSEVERRRDQFAKGMSKSLREKILAEAGPALERVVDMSMNSPKEEERGKNARFLMKAGMDMAGEGEESGEAKVIINISAGESDRIKEVGEEIDAEFTHGESEEV